MPKHFNYRVKLNANIVHLTSNYLMDWIRTGEGRPESLEVEKRGEVTEILAICTIVHNSCSAYTGWQWSPLVFVSVKWQVAQLMLTIQYLSVYHYVFIIIKTSGSESRGQEEAVCTRISGLRDHYSELSLSLLQTQHFLLRRTNSWTIDWIGLTILRN